MRSDRRRYRVDEVRYGVRRHPGGADAEWVVYVSALDGAPAERYVLRLAGPSPLPKPPYERGDVVTLDSRLLMAVAEGPS